MTTSREWLIADGLGGYAMGCANGIRTRRYHGLLLVASPSTEQRFMLVNGVEAWLERGGGTVALTAHRYVPDVVHPANAMLVAQFVADPWPSFQGGDTRFDIHGVRGQAASVLRWRVNGKARLHVRLLLSGRDWHSLHHENTAFDFGADVPAANAWRFAPYPGVPPVIVHSNARFVAAPLWHRQFQYDEERARGQDFVEDLASPGVFTWDLNGPDDEALMVLTTSPQWNGLQLAGDVMRECAVLRDRERARVAAFPSRLERAGDDYLVRRGSRRTIIAGYPWFTDWGRDTFIALRGLCLAAGRVADAEAILLSWCDHLSQGMMPNLFPAGAGAPEYNSVDASLWFAVAARELLEASPGGSEAAAHRTVLRLRSAVDDILAWYTRGTRFGIRMDHDGLLAAGAPGVALTWMDAVVDGQPATPRVGKPVEIQALWINALEFASSWNPKWQSVARRARDAFATRFWNVRRSCLYDVVDVDHVAGTADDRLRPNQVFACGGLPVVLLDGARAKAVTEAIARELWTPMGLRTLARGEPGYVGRVDGPLRERDRGYHQGTVWPWLTSAFVDAERRVNGRAAAERYTVDLERHLDVGGIGHIPEIADGDAPHTAGGCPFQAWSVGELLRAMRAFGTS